MRRTIVSKAALAILLVLALAVFLEADATEVNAAKDTTPPTGSIVINNGDAYTTSTKVTLTLTAYDPESGVNEVRYSNTGVWNKPWQKFSATKTWTLTSGEGTKTVYYQIKNNDNVISSTYSDSIILSYDDDDNDDDDDDDENDTYPNPPKPTPTNKAPSPEPTATPTHPQPNAQPNTHDNPNPNKHAKPNTHTNTTSTPMPTDSPTPTPSPQASPTPNPSPTPTTNPTPTPAPTPTPTPSSRPAEAGAFYFPPQGFYVIGAIGVAIIIAITIIVLKKQ
jgi:hypothetical protein